MYSLAKFRLLPERAICPFTIIFRNPPKITYYRDLNIHISALYLQVTGMQAKKILFHYAIEPAKGGFNIKTVQWILLIILFIYIYLPLDYLKK